MEHTKVPHTPAEDLDYEDTLSVEELNRWEEESADCAGYYPNEFDHPQQVWEFDE
jgi:hypothetical protein